MSTPASQLPQTQAETAPLRFVTAASLFDGHDAAINIMRRLIQSQGAEVIHLGHNRSVEDVVRAALQEDADAIALSSYQGGHVEYFKYMVDMLRERGAGHIRVFGGGGGTITPEEIRELQEYGVERIYHPNDGMKMGLVEMIEDVVARAGRARAEAARGDGAQANGSEDEIAIGRMLSRLEAGQRKPTLELLLASREPGPTDWPDVVRRFTEARIPRTAQVQRRARFFGEICHAGGATRLLRNALLEQADDLTAYTDWLYADVLADHLASARALTPA